MLFNQQLVLLATLLLVCLSRNRLVIAQFLLGDNCIVKHNQAPGQCKRLIICPNDLNDMRFNGTQFTECSFVAANLQQIICCATEMTSTTDTVPTGNNTDNESLRVRKCELYAQSVFETVQIVPEILGGTTTITKRRDKCVYNPDLNTRRITAQAGEFPHVAIIGYTNEEGSVVWCCGGSLVSSRYIVTTASCPKWFSFVEQFVVRLGELNVKPNTDDKTPIDIRVSTKILHPDYIESSFYNDIALLKLAQQVKLSPYIRPICLTTVADPLAYPIATSWGIFTRKRTGISLHKFGTRSFSNDECLEFYQFYYDILRNGTQMCAGPRDLEQDACQESGSPLQIYHPSVYCMYILTGIKLFGNGCGSVNAPVVYTKVYDYADWIASIIWAPGEDE